jgi:hypothetical protein
MFKISAEATSKKDAAGARARRGRDRGEIRLLFRVLRGLLATGLLLAGACGELRPVPEPIEAQAYKPIEYQDLLHPAQAGLQEGELVRVKAYFWQYLLYDPAMARNYLTLPRYPIRWYKLRWFAVYGSEQMTGYYDLAAINPELAEKYKNIKRLDHILIYGELSPLRPGVYLQVHHLEKIEEP